MKKILKSLAWLLLVGALTFAGCDFSPDCEQENFGTVIIKNETGIDIGVSVTWENHSSRAAILLKPDDEYTFFNIPAGEIYIWAQVFDVWSNEVYDLPACQIYTFTWVNDDNATNSIDPFIGEGIIVL